MYEKGLTLWSILFFYYDVAPTGLLRCRPSGACTPSETGLHTERSRGVMGLYGIIPLGRGVPVGRGETLTCDAIEIHVKYHQCNG